MKISKLFHWLYACLMLLPIFAIGVTCGYAMFNKNAYISYSNFDEDRTQYEVISSFDDLVVGQRYRFISSNIQNPNLKELATGEMRVQNVELLNYSMSVSSWDLSKITSFFVWNYSTLTYFKFNTIDNSIGNYSLMSNFIEFTFEYLGLNSVNMSNSFEYSFDNYIYKDILINQTNTIDNVFYYSVDKVTQSPLFSWAYDSFLSAPFVYILDLFGVPSTHVMVELLSYWLSVSIIWLVFDLIMYVPLLMHRWIDKGVLE